MTLKSLLFGSAAIIAAGTGAQAADLPTAEPVEYVRICDAFGTGFYYIPGTDTCLKVGGQVRAEAHYVFGDDEEDEFDDDDDDDEINFFFNNDDGDGTDDPFFNNFTTRARGNVRLDARTQTDFGLVRAFIDLEMTVGPSDFSTNYSGTSPSLAAAFVQITNDFGTFTAGHTGSFFDFFGSYGFGTRLDIDDNTTEQTLFAYTFGGGNGFSFTVSAEDPASSGRRFGIGGSALFADDDTFDDFDEALFGQEFPDGVFNIRVDQGWGSAQIMGVVGQNDAGDFDPDDFVADIPPFDDDDDFFDLIEGSDSLGWAVGAGISTKIPFLGGLEFSAQGGYSEGRLGYISVDPGGFGDFFFNPDEPTSGWNVRAGVRASFSETVDAAVSASYTSVELNIDDALEDIEILDDDDDFDIEDIEYDFFAIHANIRWKPVEGLFMGPEFAYQHITFGDAEDDFDNLEDVFDDDDDDDDDDDELEDDVFGVMFRLQRSF